MFGLAILGFFMFYFIISVIVIVIAMKWARKRNKSQDKAALIAIFIMYNLVFWDLIPVYAVRAYQCNVNAGFTVYKTVDEWKLENPGIAETLRPDDLPEQYLVETKNYDKFYHLPNGDVLKAHFSDKEHANFSQAYYLRSDNVSRSWINPRFAHETIWTKAWHIVTKIEQRIIDVKTKEVLADHIDFKSGNPPSQGWAYLKFWLQNGQCGKKNSIETYKKFAVEIRKLGEK